MSFVFCLSWNNQRSTTTWSLSRTFANIWMNELINEWVDDWWCGWMGGWFVVWMDVWMICGMDGWVGLIGCNDKWIVLFISGIGLDWLGGWMVEWKCGWMWAKYVRACIHLRKLYTSLNKATAEYFKHADLTSPKVAMLNGNHLVTTWHFPIIKIGGDVWLRQILFSTSLPQCWWMWWSFRICDRHVFF